MTETSPTPTSTGMPSPQARRMQLVAGLIVAAGAAGALAGAWYFQLVVGLAPCPLCLEQRVPYYAAVPFALVGALCAAFGKVSYARVALALAGTMVATSAALAVYHSGVEWGLWAGPSACSGTGPVATGGNLLDSLQQARVVRCDEAPWRLAGLSLAGFNALIGAVLTVVAFRASAAR